MARPEQPLNWRKSSYCSDNGCVEVAHTTSHILMRDSTDPAGTTLAFDPQAWQHFITAIKGDELAGNSEA
ncbi:DUF397 domain-containing protein [Actinoplanes sp. NPDC051343]|uniref:DUF397 domain-containing protein n=1 Tax=Actinoplanes sp. NPDC051343 TaxID=3363906 RepID=UPI003790BE61